MSKGGGLKVTELLPIQLTMKEQQREEQGVIYTVRQENHKKHCKIVTYGFL